MQIIADLLLLILVSSPFWGLLIVIYVIARRRIRKGGLSSLPHHTDGHGQGSYGHVMRRTRKQRSLERQVARMKGDLR